MKSKAGKIIVISLCVAVALGAILLCALMPGKDDDGPADETTASCKHVEAIDKAVAPTCIQQGLTEGKHCDLCGVILLEQKIVATIEHNYVDGICTMCGAQQPISLEDIFIFTEIEDGTYSVRAKDVNKMPETVVIPAMYKEKAVTVIEKSAFENCQSIISVTIPDSVVRIEKSAFYECKALADVIIGSGVTHIGIDAFSKCTGITEIHFNAIECEDFKSQNYRVFYNAGASGEGIQLVIGSKVKKLPEYMFYTDTGATVYHSPKIISVEFENGSICESIPDLAFAYCKSLERVELPSSLKIIDDGAFYYCTNLTDISIPDGVTSIGQAAFGYCATLTQISLPAELKDIHKNAFYDCKKLQSITIPSDVISVGETAFHGCVNLAEIYFNATECADLPTMSNIFYDVGKSCNGTKLIVGSNVKKIPAYFFYNSGKITNVEFEAGNKCESIGDYAFKQSAYLSSIKIPDSVFEIGYQAFAGCTSLVSIAIPDKVTSISDYVFNNCEKLASVTLPAGVISIGAGAFSHCVSLENISIPDSASNINSSAFSNCTRLNYYVYDNAGYLGNENNKYLYLYKATDKKITSVSIHKTTKFIAASAFADCTKLVDVIIPDGVIIIGNSSFNNCTSLVKIDIPDSVTIIEQAAFRDCTNLVSVTLSNSLNKIVTNLFYGCKNLTSISIPDSVTSIGHSSFRLCESLKVINIPAGITNIDNAAFFECRNVDKIYYNATECNDFESNNGIFAGVGSMGKVKVVIGANVKKLPNYMFYPSTASNAHRSCIASVEFADSSKCESIGDYAFYNCISLIGVSIPDSVTSIGERAFGHCNQLEWIEIGKSVVSMGDYAFSACSNLESVTIEYGVTSIGYGAFSSCSNLVNVTLPDSVINISDSAFQSCIKLKNIYYTGTEAQWKQISIGSNNDMSLNRATVHYNNKI